MRARDIEDLRTFLAELNLETDRGLALVCAAVCDDKLADVLLAFFIDQSPCRNLVLGADAPLGTFASRIDTCFALGLIDKFERREAHLIRRTRNEFAHAKHGISFESVKVSDLCNGFQAEMPDGPDYATPKPRIRFANSAVGLFMRLFYRSEYVLRERRQPKQWVDPQAVRWRRIDDEAPPEGTPVVVIGKSRPRRKG